MTKPQRFAYNVVKVICVLLVMLFGSYIWNLSNTVGVDILAVFAGVGLLLVFVFVVADGWTNIE